MSPHHFKKFGCHASSARWRRLSLERSTLFGIFVSLTTLDMACSSCASRCRPAFGRTSGPAPVELGAFRLSVEGEGALFSDRVRALEDPVLPGGEAREDLRLEGLRAGEAKVRLHARHRVGRHRGAL